MAIGKTTLDCNYIGITEETLASQQDELSPAGVFISANPQDNNYCWYESGGEFITPVAVDAPFFKLNGLFYPESLFVYFNKGAPEKSDLPPQFGVDMETAEFFVAQERPSDMLGIEDDLATAEETVLRHIKTTWPDAVIIDSDIRITSQANGHQNYAVYLAGYNLPRSAREDPNGTNLPEFTERHCPEWVLHQEKVTRNIQLDGWEVTLSPRGRGEGEGVYLAIPRKELKEELGNRLNRIELYAEDLRSRLGSSEYLKGDNPIRLIRDITFAGDDGVQGLYCPVFDVEILEIKKSEETCLEWVERKEKKDLRVERIGKNGYLLPLGNGRYKYISATKSRNVEDVKGVIYNRAPDQEGLDKIVSSIRILNDPVCSADEIRVDYSKTRAIAAPPEHLKDDARRLEQTFSNSPTVLKKIRGLATLGDIRSARPAEQGKTRPDNLVEIIKSELHEETPVPRMEVCLVVDQSGSMADDAQNVSDRFDELEAELAVSTDDAALCLIRFVDDEEEVMVRLTEGFDLHDRSTQMRQGLDTIAANPHGGLEYIYEAANLALDQFEHDGTAGSKRKILLLTDENGDLKDGGQTLESINRRATELGVDFKTVFIVPVDSTTPLKDYLEYLNANGIELHKMNEEERIGVWQKMLNDKNLSIKGAIEVMKRLSGVSRRNRARAVKILGGQMGRSRSEYINASGDIFAAYKALARLGGKAAEDALYSEAERLIRLDSLKHGMGIGVDEEDHDGLYTSKYILKIASALADIGTESAVLKAKKLALDHISDWYFDTEDNIILKFAKAFNNDEIEVLGRELNKQGIFVKSEILDVLGENGSRRAQEILIDFLESWMGKSGEPPNLDFRAAIAILKNRYYPKALPVLAAHFTHTAPVASRVEAEAIKILMKYEDQMNNETLREIMTASYQNSVFAYLAALMLAKRQDRYAIARLESMMNDKAMPKWVLVDASKTYKDRSALPWLERLLFNRSTDLIKNGIIEAIRQIDDDRARELVSIATSGDEENVKNAIALAKTDPKKAITQLITLCRHLDGTVRYQAASALAEVGDESAIPVLAELLNDPYPLVVDAAGRAIEEINKRVELEGVMQQGTTLED